MREARFGNAGEIWHGPSLKQNFDKCLFHNALTASCSNHRVPFLLVGRWFLYVVRAMTRAKESLKFEVLQVKSNKTRIRSAVIYSKSDIGALQPIATRPSARDTGNVFISN